MRKTSLMPQIIYKENYYAHRKRVFWIAKRLPATGDVLDVGCGTGMYLTIPLMLMREGVFGIDNSTISIEAARACARKYNVPCENFICGDIGLLESKYSCVICSEVLEHIKQPELEIFCNDIKKRVAEGGDLIITVPNGSGSYEKSVKRRKDKMEKAGNCGDSIHDKTDYNPEETMTLSDSPHVNFFSKEDVVALFEDDFTLKAFGGACMFSGYLIQKLIPPIKPVLLLNNMLGDLFPVHASGYYFHFVRREKE